MKTFIPWVGGKALLAKKIIAEFPPEIERYIEVFGGGGSILFQKKSSPYEVYNDFNSDLVNLFRCMKYHEPEMKREISGYINSREVFQEVKTRLENGVGFTDIQRAGMFYILARLSYGANCQDFGLKPRAIPTDAFEDISERLKGVIIENKDFENLIKTYDNDKSFFYCDPPYCNAEKFYTTQFLEQDHVRLKETLSHIKGKFVLSYNNVDFIRDLYKDYKIISFERSCSLDTKKDNTRPIYKELIIKNF